MVYLSIYWLKDILVDSEFGNYELRCYKQLHVEFFMVMFLAHWENTKEFDC